MQQGADMGGVGDRGWDPADLVRPVHAGSTWEAVPWWGPWARDGAEGCVVGAQTQVSEVVHTLVFLDLTGWEGPAARAAGEVCSRVGTRSLALQEQLASVASVARLLDEAVRGAVLRAAGVP